MESISDISKIKTGDCLLVSSKSILARIIQKFEKVKWNHAAMFYWCYDELMVAEADKMGVVLTPFTDYIKGKSHLLICKPDFAVDGSEYGKFILRKLGRTRYGFFNLFIAQPIKFLTFGRLWVGSNNKNPKHFICGQFVEYIYNHFNYDLFPDWLRDAPLNIFQNRHFKQYIFQR